MTTSSLDTTQSMCLNDLIAAAVQGNSSRIHSLMGSWDDEKRKLISNSMDSEETYTPLMWAAREGNAIAVEALCSYECVVKDKKGGWVSPQQTCYNSCLKIYTIILFLLCRTKVQR